MAKDLLYEQMLGALKEDLRRAEKEAASAIESLKETENKALTAHTNLHKAHTDRVALYDAVRILAAEVDNSTFSKRRARESARELLESVGIPAPATLGSSRNRKSRKKRTLTKGAAP